MQSRNENELFTDKRDCEDNDKAFSLRRSQPQHKMDWNGENPRAWNEYQNKRFDLAHNPVGQELKYIGGLGLKKCVNKTTKPPFVNRPTQVQTICHTKTKLLPEFRFTEQLQPVACPKKVNRSVRQHAERVKFADNLPCRTSALSATETDAKLIATNPFNLDLQTMTEHQERIRDAEDFHRRRDYIMCRRKMDTKHIKVNLLRKALEHNIRTFTFKFRQTVHKKPKPECATRNSNYLIYSITTKQLRRKERPQSLHLLRCRMYRRQQSRGHFLSSKSMLQRSHSAKSRAN